MTASREPRGLEGEGDRFLDRRFLVMLAAILAGVGTGLAVLPTLFRSVSTDLDRYAIVLDKLHENEADVSTIVFGNSVVMNGIDARRLAERAPAVTRAYNFSTTGQSTTESYLLHQELGSNVRSVVQLVPVTDVLRALPIDPNKYNALYMYGFRATPETRAFLTGLYGDEIDSSLGASDLEQRFRARWALRQFVDTGIRELARTDLDLERARVDLYYPSPYTKRVREAIRTKLIGDEIGRWPPGPLELRPEKVATLREMARLAQASGRELLFLLPPIQPEVRRRIDPSYPRVFVDVLASIRDDYGARWVDATDLLPDDEYVDHVHPTAQGARELTDLVARSL